MGGLRRQPLVRDQHRRARVGQHERQPLAGQPGVERNVGATRFQDPEQPDDQLHRALQTERHQRVRPHAEHPKVVSELVGARIQLSISELLRLVNDRRLVRSLLDLRFEHPMDAITHGPLSSRFVELEQQLLALTGVRSGKALTRRVGAARRPRRASGADRPAVRSPRGQTGPDRPGFSVDRV